MTPRNEFELVILFAQECVNNPDIEIVSVDGTFPDSVVRWKEQEYRVEFEYKAANFRFHGHNPVECDLIICWENNDPYSILPVVALSESDWMSKGFELTKEIEKTVAYWKHRALEAERLLKVKEAAEDESSEVKAYLREPFWFKSLADTGRILQLFDGGCVTPTAICLRVIGYKKTEIIGAIRNILAENGRLG